ncbi:hypothetical protein D1007_42452 [Hordeum vulgare]|nr:hypothetical protein D1007_42452 [Hordeum vulgare]
MDKDDFGSGSTIADLEAMMVELGLNKDNLQDVVVNDEDLPTKATRWMEIASAHTNKPYRKYWFYRNMRVAWDLAKEVKICPLEYNQYTMKFTCLGDRERVMEDGP